MKLYDEETQISILDKQHYSVVKSNRLIKKTRFSMSAQGQKVILYLISKIKPNDTEFEECEFDVIEFCEITGIDYKHKSNFEYVRNVLDSLHSQKFFIDEDRVSGVWVPTAQISETGTKIAIKFHDALKPYLLQLKDNFTSYELANILAMKSKYSIRLYELLKSESYKGSVSFEVEKLRNIMFIEAYPNYKEFKRNVIDKAINEINLYTDLNIEYEPQKTGRKICSILFHITKKDTKDNVTALLARHDRLNKRKVD